MVVAALGASFASADEGLDTSILFPTSALEEAAQTPTAAMIAGPSTDSQVAEELPHEDLDRDEARELLEGVFEVQLEGPAGIFDELAVERFLAPDVAVVDADTLPDGDTQAEDGGEIAGAALVDSTLPLRAESSSGELAAIDLSLEASEGELQPVNPLVEVGIPREIGDGIKLPGPDVAIEIAGAPAERTASVVDQGVAFLPNIATDTDLAIAPTPTGVETLTHLRSADAPHTQTFDLDLPDDAILEAADDGGAVVRDGEGEILVSVSAPTAIDAAGNSVPVSLEVQGHSLLLSTTPEASTQYPVLVDPLFQTYEWAKSNYLQSGICNSSFKIEMSGSCNDREEWGYEHIEKNSPLHISLDNRVYGASAPVPQGTPGLSIQTSGTLTAGDKGAMVYTVPRYFTDQEKYGVRPTSFIASMKLSNLDWNAYSSSLSPYLSAGIWDTVNGGWISYYTHEGLNGHGLTDMNFQYQFSNYTEAAGGNTNGKVAAVTVNATTTGPTQVTGVYVGNATIQLADNGAPTAGPVSGPSQWVDQTAKPITFTASDTGLGAYALVATDEAAPPHSWKTSRGCTGVAGDPCPRQWKSTDAGSPALKYEPALMSQGINYLSVVAEDPVGNKSAPSYAEIKVDHTKPSLALSGSMTEQATLGTNLSSYVLKYDATDGDSSKPQSGVVSAQVKLDGQVVKSDAPGCATKNCSLSKEWTLNADSYSVGTHNLEVIATDGVGLTTTKSITVETHGDLVAPSLALSGSMTEQASLGTTRPNYVLKVNATDPGGAEERKSGVASTTIKVDGKVVDTSAPGCPAGGCSIWREWSLKALDYEVGAHVATVTATDAAGRSKTETLNFNIALDTTSPTISAPNSKPFYDAPEGWLEQKIYLVMATSADAAGYGITSMALKIDGKTVKSSSQSCPAGGCSLSFGVATVNMAAYDGGAHPAELIATDGAGNTAKKTWTINVDPNGVITLAEAEDTLEAVDETADSTIAVPTDEAISAEERADGNDPALVEGEGALISKGVYNPSAVEADPEEGFKIVLPETTIEATPVQVVSAATDVEVVEEVAGVSANALPNVDLITRPKYNGLTTFANIRDASGAESFSWEVDLQEGQSLAQIDPLDAEVQFANGKRVMLIAAERAHDAVGTNVPTSLSVSEGNVLTLTVDHNGANYVYPIVAGAGWEGGYTHNLIVGPKDEQEVKEEQERIAKEQQEALERTWEQEVAGTGEDAPPGGPSVPIDPNDPMRPVFLRQTVTAPEMVDYQARKRRSKATPAWCAASGCGIWSSEAVATWYWNGKQGTPGGFAWRGDTVWRCHTDGAWWVDTNITKAGWAGPNPAPYGYGQHLMLFCTFVVSYVSSVGREDPKFQLYANLYGSGYEGVHIREIDPFLLEN